MKDNRQPGVPKVAEAGTTTSKTWHGIGATTRMGSTAHLAPVKCGTGESKTETTQKEDNYY